LLVPLLLDNRGQWPVAPTPVRNEGGAIPLFSARIISWLAPCLPCKSNVRNSFASCDAFKRNPHHVAGKAGYLFRAKNGSHYNSETRGKKGGFHAFRRFRTETLRRPRVQQDVAKLWLAHLSKLLPTSTKRIGKRRGVKTGMVRACSLPPGAPF
jgi:hypothetical protein